MLLSPSPMEIPWCPFWLGADAENLCRSQGSALVRPAPRQGFIHGHSCAPQPELRRPKATLSQIEREPGCQAQGTARPRPDALPGQGRAKAPASPD